MQSFRHTRTCPSILIQFKRIIEKLALLLHWMLMDVDDSVVSGVWIALWDLNTLLSALGISSCKLVRGKPVSHFSIAGRPFEWSLQNKSNAAFGVRQFPLCPLLFCHHCCGNTAVSTWRRWLSHPLWGNCYLASLQISVIFTQKSVFAQMIHW